MERERTKLDVGYVPQVWNILGKKQKKRMIVLLSVLNNNIEF